MLDNPLLSDTEKLDILRRKMDTSIKSTEPTPPVAPAVPPAPLPAPVANGCTGGMGAVAAPSQPPPTAEQQTAVIM